MHYVSLSNRNFFFKFDQLDVTFYAHFIDFSLYVISIKNDSNHYIKILKNHHLNTIQKVDFDNCYHITSKKINVFKMINRHSQKKYQ